MMFNKQFLKLSLSDIDTFRNDGYLILRNAVSKKFLETLRESVSRWTLRMLSELDLPQKKISSDPNEFDANLLILREYSPVEAGYVYDAIKKIPLLMQWASSPELVSLAQTLLPSSDIGIASRGWGIRIDYPRDNFHRTQLHQEFVSQMCGPDGLVVWSPLRDVTQDLGPVVFYPRSHLTGLFPLDIGGTSSQAQRIKNEEVVRSNFIRQQPELAAGDLLILDFLTLHESGDNISAVPRWSMTTRLFNSADPISVSMRWKGGIQEGNVVSDLSPPIKTKLGVTL